MAVDNARTLYQHLPSGSVLTSRSLLLPSTISTKRHTHEHEHAHKDSGMATSQKKKKKAHHLFRRRQFPAPNLIKERSCGAWSIRNKLQLHLICEYLRLRNTCFLRKAEPNRSLWEEKQMLHLRFPGRQRARFLPRRTAS